MRGWVTWLMPVVDARVKAIMPMGIDVLNMVKSLHHHHRSLGKWSEAIADYEKLGVTARIGSPEFKELASYIDPHRFRQHLARVPKYIVAAANDPFFMPDAAQFYFPKLPGQKALRYGPNNGHYLLGFPPLHTRFTRFLSWLLGGTYFARI